MEYLIIISDFISEEAFVKQTGTVAEINNNSDDNKKKEPHDGILV